LLLQKLSPAEMLERWDWVVMLDKEIGKARMLLGVVESSRLAELSGLMSESIFSLLCKCFKLFR
jgi:hypothetical protein